METGTKSIWVKMGLMRNVNTMLKSLTSDLMKWFTSNQFVNETHPVRRFKSWENICAAVSLNICKASTSAWAGHDPTCRLEPLSRYLLSTSGGPEHLPTTSSGLLTQTHSEALEEN